MFISEKIPDFVYTSKMNVAGSIQIPKEMLCLILAFEGSALTAFQLDYIGSVYIAAYRQAFGWASTIRPKMRLYMQLAQHIHSNKQKWHIKIRKSRKHFLPWRQAFKAELYYLLPYLEKAAFNHIAEDRWPIKVLDMMLNYK